MHRRVWTEWLLARYIGQARATAIVGDLKELAETRGTWWFLWSYVRVLCSWSWRAPMAFGGAYVASILLWKLFQLQSENIVHHRPLNAFLEGLLAAVLVPMWFAFPYSLIRFGWRDKLSQLGFAMFVLGTLTSSLLFLPWVLPLFAFVLTVTTFFGVFSRQWRGPILALAAIIGVGFGGVILIFQVGGVLLLAHGSWPRGIRILIIEVSQVIGFLLLTTVCLQSHKLLIERGAGIDELA